MIASLAAAAQALRRSHLPVRLALVAGGLLAGSGDVAAQPAAGPDSAYIATHYTKREARIPMRDGVRLHTAIYVPKDASAARRYPVVLQRTPFSVAPYGPALPKSLGPSPFMLRDGYVYVNQEVRGRYQSEGEFENVRPLMADSLRGRDPRATDEATDAFDTVEWLLRNVPEADGRVGLLGVSYGGYYAAAAAARAGHPAIVATSLQAPVTDFFFEDFHQNGALLQGHILSYPIFGTPRAEPTGSHWWLPRFLGVVSQATGDDYAFQLGLGPLRNVTRRFYAEDRWWRSMVDHPNYDAFWQARAIAPHLRHVRHPVLVVGGWFDAENLYGAMEAYRALRGSDARGDVSLVMGPFAHRGWADRGGPRTTHGDLVFGDSLHVAYQRDVEAVFFRAHLKGAAARPMRGAWMFDTGRKAWASFDAWPAAQATPRAFHFHADGSLGASLQAGGAPYAEYVSDPAKPVPSRCNGPTIEDVGLNLYMSDDQRCFGKRPDVVVFQTGVLEEDVTLGGPLTARLWVSTTGTDADFVVKLIDVYPPPAEGDEAPADTVEARLADYQQLVRGQVMRGRFRRSFSEPAPFRPDQVEEVSFALPDVFHTFRKGHRIMVQVQSSWFPLIDRNPQRYVPSIYEAGEEDFVRAIHRVWTTGETASRLEAHVLP
jgi:putative CocE/NonD family hydrolase